MMPVDDDELAADRRVYPPVQICPICEAPGTFVGERRKIAFTSLALDAKCTRCGLFYTTTARKAVLAALTRGKS
jgi:hypothetical protein